MERVIHSTDLLMEPIYGHVALKVSRYYEASLSTSALWMKTSWAAPTYKVPCTTFEPA